MAETVVAEARGSIRVICLADVPAATRFRDGRAVSESMACEVDLVSTQVEVGRSHVFSE